MLPRMGREELPGTARANYRKAYCLKFDFLVSGFRKVASGVGQTFFALRPIPAANDLPRGHRRPVTEGTVVQCDARDHQLEEFRARGAVRFEGTRVSRPGR